MLIYIRDYDNWFLNLKIKEVTIMAVQMLNIEEALNLLDLPSDTDEEKIRLELDKYNFMNGTQYVLENQQKGMNV